MVETLEELSPTAIGNVTSRKRSIITAYKV